MLGRQVNFRRLQGRGRRTVVAIMLIFTTFSGLGLFLSMSTTTGAKHRAAIVQVAARQRTLAERYAKNVLLVREGVAADPGATARVLQRSAAVLLDGGIAPSVDGDDDQTRVPRQNGPIARSQLKQEQRLVHDLVATGAALVAKRPGPVRLTAGEHFSSALSPDERLMVLTGLTSNVSLNVARTIVHSEDAQLNRLMNEQVFLSALGLLVFGLLSWALVASTRRESAHFLVQERLANEKLRELDVMKDEFVALVSHELRTPLTAIKGYTELVLDGTAGELNDEQSSMLTAIDRSSSRLFRLINDLLFVAQVNAGKLSVAIEDVDLAAVAREAVEDARPRAVAAGISLDFESGLTPTVKADPGRLGQVLDNLISNSPTLKWIPSFLLSSCARTSSNGRSFVAFRLRPSCLVASTAGSTESSFGGAPTSRDGLSSRSRMNTGERR